MKPLWIHTLVWVAAVAVALLFALAGPDGTDFKAPQGAAVPR
jgi:hypothetical protein